MKLTISKQQLLKIINTVQKAVSSKTIMPILECIKIDAEANGTLAVTGNNLDLCIEYIDECNVQEGGSIAISSKIFGEIVRRLPDSDILITVNEENNVMTIKCGKSEFNIQGLSSYEYPAVPDITETYRFTIKQTVLKKMIRKTIFAVSQNEARKPILTGSLFEIETGVLSIVSTDGYRLAMCKEIVDSSLESKKFVLPGLTLREIFKVLEDDEEKTVSVIVSDRHAMFEFDRYRVITRLLEGEYINYKPVLTTPNSIVVVANTAELSESLERASLLINDDISAKAEKVPVRLNIVMDKIEITCMTGKGKVHDVVDVSVSGDDIEIGFNHKYLLEALRACEEEEVKMEFSNPRSSCFIRSNSNDDSYVFMILPVRLYN
ncbi:MAG: DNA polymerase III subunit beta [Clostridiales bacterium]|nr:DNA polymerase III subunit beta [Clostridiales bacterium]